MTEFFDSSQQILNVKAGNKVGQGKYPWKEVPTGKSFAVPRENIQFKTLRSLASIMGKKHGRRFRCFDHGENSPYEVACLPMTEAQAIASGSLIDALNAAKAKD